MKEFFKECSSCNGRWNRKKFWLYPIGISILLFAPLLIIMTIVGNNETISMVLGVIFVLAYIYITYVSIAAYIKRLHDLDKTGWMSLLIFIPFANIYLWIICGFFRGTKGKNKFGDNPLGNMIPESKKSTPNEL